jgi:hypothetical protein
VLPVTVALSGEPLLEQDELIHGSSSERAGRAPLVPLS